MADYYYRSIGDAFRGLVNWSQANLLDGTVPNTSVSMAFTSFGGTGTQTGFYVTSSLPSSPDSFFIAEALVGRVMDLAWIVRQPGLTQGLDGTFPDPSSGFYGFDDIASKIHDCLVGVIAGMTGATHGTFGFYGFSLDGAHTCASAYFDAYKTANDIAAFLLYQTNRAYGPTNIPISQPFGCVYPNEGNIQSLSKPGLVINEAPQLDADVSINGGQAILSVISRTITFMPEDPR